MGNARTEELSRTEPFIELGFIFFLINFTSETKSSLLSLLLTGPVCLRTFAHAGLYLHHILPVDVDPADSWHPPWALLRCSLLRKNSSDHLKSLTHLHTVPKPPSDTLWCTHIFFFCCPHWSWGFSFSFIVLSGLAVQWAFSKYLLTQIMSEWGSGLAPDFLALSLTLTGHFYDDKSRL